MNKLSIISYNVNGIRAADKKGFTDWVLEGGYDIVCVQETKAQPEQFDSSRLHEAGYDEYWHSAEKKGYSGVATFSKLDADSVIAGTGMHYDTEGRVLRTDFGDVTLLNCYFPSGTSGDIRQAVKMEFLDDFLDWVKKLRKTRKKLIIVGDYNIAHTENDIHDPVRNKKTSGFLPEERAWMSKWFDSGFTDSFRRLHPEKTEYSWWSYRARARERNKGWRIDYISVSDNLKDNLVAAGHYNDAVHSDHCPVYLEIEI